MTWREHYAPKIKAIIDANKDKTVKELRRILYKANPGQYTHMKRTWSDESLKQLGLKKRKPRYAPGKKNINNPNQTDLFL